MEWSGQLLVECSIAFGEGESSGSGITQTTVALVGSAATCVKISVKEREGKSKPAKRPRSLRKDSLASKLARISLQGPLT
eukprot:1160495-Pelagomonas_calceolata.AAC.7